MHYLTCTGTCLTPIVTNGGASAGASQTTKIHFHQQNRVSGKCIAIDMAELRWPTSKCNFGAYLEEALCDSPVCGLLSETMQTALLLEDQTLKCVVEVARGLEAAHTWPIS